MLQCAKNINAMFYVLIAILKNSGHSMRRMRSLASAQAHNQYVTVAPTNVEKSNPKGPNGIVKYHHMDADK